MFMHTVPFSLNSVTEEMTRGNSCDSVSGICTVTADWWEASEVLLGARVQLEGTPAAAKLHGGP